MGGKKFYMTEDENLNWIIQIKAVLACHNTAKCQISFVLYCTLFSLKNFLSYFIRKTYWQIFTIISVYCHDIHFIAKMTL
jgi:hypothetical protein